MAITREKKESVIRTVESLLKDAGSVVFVGYKKISVKDSADMRKLLRAENVRYTVAKKTLMRRALESTGIEGTQPELPGEVAMVYGPDQVAPAREINVFVKKFKDSLAILGGIFDGKYMDARAMTNIALIPSQKTLYAQIAYAMNSPMQQMAIVFSEYAKTKEANK